MMEVNDVINRVKNLKEYLVELDLPEDFSFRGRVPFDLRIDGEKIQAKCLAENREEAVRRVYAYFSA